MNRQNVERWRTRWVILALAGVAVGLVFSPPVVSIGLLMVTAAGLLDPLAGINPRWRAGIGGALRSSFFWGLAGLYLLLLFGVWQTEDWGYYLERIRIKIPLLALPLAWPGLHWPRGLPVAGERARFVFAGFVGLVLAGVLVNYFLDAAAINDLIRRGQAVPVPRGDHVRFSLLVALATVALAAGSPRRWRYWWLGLLLFLFVGQHLLAVRTGLATAYAGLAVLLLGRAVRRGSARLAVGGLLGLLLLPLLAYQFVPSFRTKMNYARYELLHRNPLADGGDYSDAGRLTSIRLGLEVWRAHPVLGVGPGNLRRAMDAKYAEVLPGAEAKRPHNQFVSALAGGGLFGFAVTVGCFWLLIGGGGRWRDPGYCAVWTMLFLSCLVENTLESSAGVTLFTLALLLTRPPDDIRDGEMSAYPPSRKLG